MNILTSDLDLTVTVARNLIAFVIFEKYTSLATVSYWKTLGPQMGGNQKAPEAGDGCLLSTCIKFFALYVKVAGRLKLC